MACPCQSCCHWRKTMKKKKRKKRHRGKVLIRSEDSERFKHRSAEKRVFIPRRPQLRPKIHEPLPPSCETLQINETCYSALAWLRLRYLPVLLDCAGCQTKNLKTCVSNICLFFFIQLSDKHMTSSIISPLLLQLSPVCH